MTVQRGLLDFSESSLQDPKREANGGLAELVRTLLPCLSGLGSSPANGLLLVGRGVRDLRGTQARALAGTSVVLVGPVPHIVNNIPGGIIQP